MEALCKLAVLPGSEAQIIAEVRGCEQKNSVIILSVGGEGGGGGYNLFFFRSLLLLFCGGIDNLRYIYI